MLFRKISFLALYNSFANKQMFLGWIESELSFTKIYSNAELWQLQAILYAWARSCRWLMLLFQHLLQKIHTRRQFANWNFINAFVRDLQRSSAQSFFFPFFIFIKFHVPTNFVPCFAVFGFGQYLPTSFHAYSKKEVSDICHYLVSYKYFRTI